MTWKNLEEDLAEELGQVGLDSASLFKDGLRWQRPLKEDRKNYNKWYWKHVWYPKNKETHRLKQKQRYYEERSDPVKLEKQRERKRNYERSNCRKGSVQRERRMEMQRKRMAKLKADPVAYAAYREKWNARRRVKDLGKKATSSPRE